MSSFHSVKKCILKTYFHLVGRNGHNFESAIDVFDFSFDTMCIWKPFGKLVDIIPYPFMLGVKNVGSIFVDTYSILINVIIAIATYMASFVNN